MNEWFPIPAYRTYRTFILTLTCGHHRTTTAMPAMNYSAYGCHCTRWYQRVIAACEIK